MAIRENGGVNAIGQAQARDYFSTTYQTYCRKLATLHGLPGNASDESMTDAQDDADHTLQAILTAPALTQADLAFKIKALQLGERDRLHSTGDDEGPMRSYAIIAADLDSIIAGEASNQASIPVAELHFPSKPVNLDDFRRNLAAAQSIVSVVAIAAESEAHENMPTEALWRTLHAASDLVQTCIDEFDSDAFEAAWRGKAVRS